MIKCPSCGYENVPGTQFCEGCGEELAQDAAPGGATASAPTADGGMVQCPACDNMNPAENVVCEVCGTELKPGGAALVAEEEAPEEQPDASKVGLATGDVTAVAPGVDTTMSTPPTSPFDTSFDLPPMVPTTTAFDAMLPDLSAATPAAAATPVVAAGVTTSAATSTISDTTLPAAPVVGGTPVPPMVPPMAAPPLPAGDLQPGRVKLVVEQGMTVGQQFVLGDPEIQVGREDEEEDIYPDIDLSDQDAGYVHRRHATLRFENGNLTVTHLGGVNKTRVNNRPLPDNVAQPVKLGDKIAFGKVVLRVQPV